VIVGEITHNTCLFIDNGSPKGVKTKAFTSIFEHQDQMELLLCAAYAALFVEVIRRAAFFRDREIPTGWLQTAFLLKVLAGMVLGWIYYQHYRDRYTSDTIKFFDDSGILFDSLKEKPYDFFRMLTGIDGNAPELRHYYENMNAWLNRDVLFNDNKTIIRLNAFFRFFSCGQYYVHVVFINFISFTGLYALYSALSEALQGRRRLYFTLVFLMPSLLLWGSGLLKDGLMLFALGMTMRFFIRILNGRTNFRNLFSLTCSLFLLLFSKFYVVMTVLPGLAAWVISRKMQGRSSVLVFTATYSVFLLAGFNVYRIFPEYDLSELIYWKQHNFLQMSDLLNPASRIPVPELEHGFGSILKNAPGAFLRSILHPAVTDRPENTLVVLAGIENLLLLGFLTLLLVRCLHRHPGPIGPAQLFSLFVTLIVLTLIGLITPVLGAMVRYKIVVYPFLFFLWTWLLDARKTSKLLPFLSDRRG
jgi:hypothetical protein